VADSVELLAGNANYQLAMEMHGRPIIDRSFAVGQLNTKLVLLPGAWAD
jgi:hypothetical protein